MAFLFSDPLITLMQLAGGAILELPPNCPPYMHELMLECWSRKPHGRPDVEQLADELRTMLSNPMLDPVCRTCRLTQTLIPTGQDTRDRLPCM